MTKLLDEDKPSDYRDDTCANLLEGYPEAKLRNYMSRRGSYYLQSNL